MAKRLILVAGNIGAGKTSLTERLGARLGWHTAFESVADNPYLGDFYGDMRAWSFHLQVFFLGHRAQQHLDMLALPQSVIIDRSIYEDVEIFAYTLHQQGNMSERDYQNYQDLFAIMVEHLRKPDLILYLKADIDHLLAHIKKRGREYEQTIDPVYLKQLNDAYDAWIERARKNNFHIVTFDMKHRDFENNEEDFKIIYDSIKDLENQTWLNGV